MVALLHVCHLVTVPCFCGSLILPTSIPSCRVPPSILGHSPPTHKQSPLPRLAPQSPHSSTHPSCTLADIRIPGLSMSMQGLMAWATSNVNLTLSYFATDQLFHSLLTAQIFPSVPTNLPISGSFSRCGETLCSSNSLQRCVCPIPIPLFPFFFISSCLGMWGSFLSFLASRVFC